MRDIGAEFAGTGQTHHRVEVRAIEIDLTAYRVDNFANLDDVLLEYPVG